MATASHPQHTPRFNRRLFTFFGVYIRNYFRRHFHAVRISKAGPAPELGEAPAIFYTNHPSWWDPILLMLLGSRLYADREHYGPMEAEALEKYAFFRKLGVFPVEKESRRGAVEFLRSATFVLQRPLGTLWLTAEGAFTDPRARPIALRPGLAHFLRRRPHTSVFPVALEYPFWNERFPEALLRFGPSVPGEALQGSSKEINATLAARLEQVMDGLASEAMNRDAAAFTTLVRGNAGVGLVFDLWRRGKAYLKKESFSREHDPQPGTEESRQR